MKSRYWWVILTYIAMQFSIYLLVPLHSIMGVETPLEDWIETKEVVGTWVFYSFTIGLLLIIYLLRQDIKERHQAPNRVSRLSAVKWSIIGVFLAFAAQITAGLIEVNLFNIEAGSENTESLVEIAKALPLFVIVGGLIAPILEEILFRKIIFGSLYKKFNNFFVAAIISSLLFAVIHVDFTHLLIYTAMGFTFAYLYVKTNRILVPIIAHAAMNSIVFLMNFFVDIEELEKQLEQAIAIFIGGIF
ncbi:CPBP family intramembrane metalloprotease [Lottiidibacillus patelloidae]|uniref:CPBP family intramembrane metalloprotease n=1 Tax=Lottiidibacillus patelloidae TaxID=2670334 RepID=A0A263BPW9_9BACI|nr:CPBP family intramembrane glutamic endopeptidase [Lottiidibacillus patelloidae]OZM55805.1 CPBP family intramembrane metalloprotease [Lottiidibacillus patelloidae]